MQVIPIGNLLYMLPSIFIVTTFYYLWVGNKSEIFIATLRMSVQLILIGYVLTTLFNTNSYPLLIFLLIVMVTVSSWIARRNITQRDWKTYFVILCSIAIGGGVNLLLVLCFVLDLDEPFKPRFVIPLAGMFFANAMNALSLAAERYEKELLRSSKEEARGVAFKASMIPQINSFLAIGFVSLPGMMTGQILSGVEPLVAVRYQIVVMAMILSSGAMSNILYLSYKTKNY